MKICFIAPANNYHTKKWTNWFVNRGHEVHVVSFIKDEIEGATVHFLDTGASAEGSDTSKLKYLLSAGKMKRTVNSIKPDIINVHYATSYGAVVALSGLKNYVLSVWGSDVYDFPNKSIFHKLLLEFSLKKAKYLFSTSNAMAEECSKYTNKKFFITPFGVDMELFSPKKRSRDSRDGRFIIGTVKGLRDVYGIQYVLSAASLFSKRCPDANLEIRIAGQGPDEMKYRQLAEQLGISERVKWLGFISQEEAAREWANMDVAVIPSLQESFGVSAVEAQASGTAVIISDVPGLMEATIPGKSSIVVKRKNANDLANAIAYLYRNPNKRKNIGEHGRFFVFNAYEIDACFKRIESKYKQILR